MSCNFLFSFLVFITPRNLSGYYYRPPIVPPIVLVLQSRDPAIERSREPLGDPSARVFEVFLIVNQSGNRDWRNCYLDDDDGDWSRRTTEPYILAFVCRGKKTKP